MTYIIGDVHGEFDSLKALKDKLPQNANLVFVGDLVDRGKKSNFKLSLNYHHRWINNGGKQTFIYNYLLKKMKNQ